ncbi:hypothetical protein EPO15_01870 [bacterium]|nr:MAG: hypothetical protein EPO15_01870 [bacterium]
MTAAVLALLLASPASAAPRPSLAGARRWACFYGHALSSAAWRSVDMVVLDADNYSVEAATGPLRLAYVSAGEADERRSSWPKAVGRPFLVEPNPDWPGAYRVDPRSPEWLELVDAQVSSALAKGFDGVMFDTLDVAEYLESKSPERFPGAVQGAADLVLEIRRRHPEALLVMNNGLALLDKAGSALDGLVVEDLYTECMPGDKPCGPSKPESTAAKEPVLERFRASGRPVFVLLYSRFAERRSKWVRRAAARSRQKGFFPYLSSPTLERLGVVDPFAP